jgi:hypothetical protein
VAIFVGIARFVAFTTRFVARALARNADALLHGRSARVAVRPTVAAANGNEKDGTRIRPPDTNTGRVDSAASLLDRKKAIFTDRARFVLLATTRLRRTVSDRLATVGPRDLATVGPFRRFAGYAATSCRRKKQQRRPRPQGPHW